MTSGDILMLIATIAFVCFIVSEILANKRIIDCCRALSLVGKRGSFKFKGQILEGKVILADIDKPMITVEVVDVWYSMHPRRFKEFKEGNE
jgi:hypothetical protein